MPRVPVSFANRWTSYNFGRSSRTFAAGELLHSPRNSPGCHQTLAAFGRYSLPDPLLASLGLAWPCLALLGSAPSATLVLLHCAHLRKTFLLILLGLRLGSIPTTYLATRVLDFLCLKLPPPHFDLHTDDPRSGFSSSLLLLLLIFVANILVIPTHRLSNIARIGVWLYFYFHETTTYEAALPPNRRQLHLIAPAITSVSRTSVQSQSAPARLVKPGWSFTLVIIAVRLFCAPVPLCTAWFQTCHDEARCPDSLQAAFTHTQYRRLN